MIVLLYKKSELVSKNRHKLNETYFRVIAMYKIQTIKIKHKITKNIIPQQSGKTARKTFFAKKQTIDEIFYNFSCLSLVNYGKMSEG